LPVSLGLKQFSEIGAKVTLAILSLAAIVRIARGSVSQIYRGRREFFRGLMLGLVAPAMTVPVVVVLGLLGAPPVWIAVAMLSCELIGSATYLIDLTRRYPDIRLELALPHGSELRRMVHAVPQLTLIQSLPTIWLQAPVILLGCVGSDSQTILAFVSLRTLVNSVRQVTSMLALSVGVELAGTFAQSKNAAAIERHLRQMGRVICSLTGSASAAMVVFGAPLVRIWTGSANLCDQALVIPMIAAIIAAAPTLPLLAMATHGGNPRPASISAVVQCAVGLAAAITLMPRLGVLGLVLGLAIGESVACLLLLPYLLTRYMTFDWTSYLVSCFGVATAAGAWSFLVGATVSRLVLGLGPLGVMLGLAAWGVLGLLPAIYLVVDAPQRASLVKAIGPWWRVGLAGAFRRP
jgi:O-antigen/teichoic acid export membrane protein